ncbi:MAG: hypothetical protein NC205_02515 [Prevotella sp.]|nr:hypothetical protein [Alistipes senegalensis]MCM1357441.1 hypothetical protein [Prevotella sp.]MCM1473248.1 hypothetical protein [Muribaculaceae bacterium]MDE6424821.1 hypothetical protein [Ruminococcus sp.]
MNIDNILENFNDKETECRFNSNDIQKNSVAAVLPYLIPVLFFLPVIADKNSVFCKFHANQQLTWFIVSIVLDIIIKIIGIIPFFGGIARILIGIVQVLVSIALAYGAYKGKALKLPFIGDLLNIF